MEQTPAVPGGDALEQPRSDSIVPSLELWVALALSILPHAVAVLFGGYGSIIVNAPIAIILTVVDAAAIVIAVLQLRDDSRANRPSHWAVWATMVVGGIWILYAVLVGAVLILGRIFCLSETCRGPLGRAG